ncbi:MAG: hypothetical protein HYW49_01795 [Deltaproteobacteria bacterium]|nr:hypothetical protein [Deltaproteobacteria bacterium]
MKKRILFVMVSVFALAPAVMGAPLLGEGTKNATLGKQDCEARIAMTSSSGRSTLRRFAKPI